MIIIELFSLTGGMLFFEYFNCGLYDVECLQMSKIYMVDFVGCVLLRRGECGFRWVD